MSEPTRLASLRTAFLSGLFLLAPLVVTIWAFTKIIEFVGGTFRPLFFGYLPETLRDRPNLTIIWDALATIAVIVVITLLGYVSRYVFGRYFLGVGERFVQSIPGVSAVYNTVKQIVQTFSSQNRNLFNKVVMIEFPRKGNWAVGFLTNKTNGEPQQRSGQETWTVFIPTSPNPTSGFLLLVPRSEIIELEMSVGDGMKMIISGGAVVPPWPAVRAASLK